MLAGISGGGRHSHGNLTALPASLEILKICTINIGKCRLDDCRPYSLCEVMMGNLRGLLERKNEFTPRLTNLEVVFRGVFESADSGRKHAAWRKFRPSMEELEPLGEHVGVEVGVVFSR